MRLAASRKVGMAWIVHVKTRPPASRKRATTRVISGEKAYMEEWAVGLSPAPARSRSAAMIAMAATTAARGEIRPRRLSPASPAMARRAVAPAAASAATLRRAAARRGCG